jgi:carbon storage regulator
VGIKIRPEHGMPIMTTLGLRRSGLVLTRRPGESIMIGDNIAITISGVHGNQVRVHVDAPRDIPVHRGEVYERVLAEKERGK